jgi:NADH-quinone oxidoreductase subunit A
MKEEYLTIFIFICFGIFLSLLLIVLSYFLVTQNPETEKLSTYECGFEPYEDARNKFNVRFYIIAILFILFDIEIIFFLPWCVSISQLNLLGFWSMIEFLFELGIGFIYVWCVGALEWS